MLEEPRALLLRALLPLDPPPPKAPELRDPPPLGTLRFPTRSPPTLRFALMLPADGPPEFRLPPALRSLIAACCRPPEFMRSRPAACCGRLPAARSLTPPCRLFPR